MHDGARRDDHCHTNYSGHSAPDCLVGNMVRTAAERKLRHVVVLEHLPTLPRGLTLNQWREARNDRAHIDTIAAEIAAARPDHPELEILLGVEIDADPWALDGSLMLADFSGIDVVVAATHVLPGGDCFWFEPVHIPDPATRRELVRKWFDWTEKIVAGGQGDTLAHPGCEIAARALIDSFADDEIIPGFERLGALMAENGVAFELNEALVYKLPPPCAATYSQVVRAVAEQGVRFTLGTDSHSPASIGNYAWTLELIDNAGLTPDRLAPLERGARGTIP